MQIVNRAISPLRRNLDVDEVGSMGMVMLPPTVISLPFKILLFVLVDGWSLVAESLVRGFNT